MNRRGFFASAFGFAAGVALGECTKKKVVTVPLPKTPLPEVKWRSVEITGLRPRYWEVQLPVEPGTYDVYLQDNRILFDLWKDKETR